MKVKVVWTEGKQTHAMNLVLSDSSEFVGFREFPMNDGRRIWLNIASIIKIEESWNGVVIAPSSESAKGSSI
jgi:hypothetical protein